MTPLPLHELVGARHARRATALAAAALAVLLAIDLAGGSHVALSGL